MLHSVDNCFSLDIAVSIVESAFPSFFICHA
jgi:hypothetical protein